jgi:putative ABC transport system permease protein
MRGDGQIDRPRWVLTREQRLTWMRELPPDNRLVEGALWSDPATNEVSLEQEFAADLGAGLGSVLRFDVQGVPVELTVTSIRTVEWESFSINFFLVAEPGALDAAPHALLGAARIDAADEQPFQDELARAFANVTPIRVRAVLEKVMDVLGKLAVGVRMLGGFTIAVGLLILAGVASAGAVHRGREVALLKALGVRRLTIAGLFATEFGLLGLVAGIVGGIAAAVLSWVFLDRIAEAGGPFAWWAPLRRRAGDRDARRRLRVARERARVVGAADRDAARLAFRRFASARGATEPRSVWQARGPDFAHAAYRP